MLQVLSSSKTTKILVFFLFVFGLVVISSAGIVDSQKKFGTPYYYLTHQLFYGAIGLILFFLASRIGYKIWKKYALLILLTAITLLVLVFVPSVGFGLKGAQRWIHFGPLTFQPSEVLKVALIIYLAAWFSGRREGKNASWSSMIPFFAILACVFALLIKQPDVGTLGVITMIALGMYFFSGVSMKQFISVILLALAVISVVVFVSPYRLSRITTYLNRSSDPQGGSYHINQSLIGIGSGGIFGLGYGQSKQKFSYLPEPVGDSVFSIIGEELGLVGMTFVLILFLLLILNLISIAKGASDNFAKMTVLGIAVWITGQAFINIAAISGLIPLTGVPLPFISYGGTAIVALLGSLGIAVNIAEKG